MERIVLGVDALINGFTASGLDTHQAIIAHAGQDLDHLPVAIIAAAQLASDRGHGRWQNPIFERGTVAQRTRFAGQNRHIVPWIVDCLPTISPSCRMTIRSA